MFPAREPLLLGRRDNVLRPRPAPRRCRGRRRRCPEWLSSVVEFQPDLNNSQEKAMQAFRHACANWRCVRSACDLVCFSKPVDFSRQLVPQTALRYELVMKNRWKRILALVNRASSQDKPAPVKSSSIIGWKLWLFRLLTVVVIPIVFFALVELTLRLAGFGHPTKFLLSFSQDGQKKFILNNQFTWRFLGAEMERTPFPIFTPQIKTPDTVRIFVFGESRLLAIRNRVLACPTCCNPCWNCVIPARDLRW